VSTAVSEKNSSTALVVNNAPNHVAWATRLNEQWEALRQDTVEAFIRLGNDLIAAKEAVGHGGFGVWCEKNLKFSWDTANGLMQIARWIANSDPDRNLLPPDWTTLRQLARLDGESFTQLVQDGTINPDASRREIEHQIKQKSARISTSRSPKTLGSRRS
jgi:hypothetical protein